MTNMFADEDMGKWYWVYLMGQIFSAPLAGFIAGQLLTKLNNAYDTNQQNKKESKDDYDRNDNNIVDTFLN